MLKKEPYVIWLILNIINSHPFLSKYAKTLLKFTLQGNFEVTILPTKNGFKYDICFGNIHIVVEIDENHHMENYVKITDNEKDALASLHGKNLIRFSTNKFDNIINIKKNIKLDLIERVKNNKINFVDKLCKLNFVEKNLNKVKKQILIDRVLYQIYGKFVKKQTKHRTEKNKQFIAIFNADQQQKLEKYIAIMLNKYIDPLIESRIHINIKNSSYLHDFNKTFIDNIINASLNDYDFRLDYIKTIFTETIFDRYESSVDILNEIINENDKSVNQALEECNKFKKIMNDLLLILVVLIKFLNLNEKVYKI
jgi:hypothetical protein